MSEKKKKPEDTAAQNAAKQQEETAESAKEQSAAAQESENDDCRLQKDLDEKSDQLLRLAAEYDNFRKRSVKEKEELYTSIRAQVIGEFLAVQDNFERAAQNTQANAEDYRKGVEMIFQQFSQILQKLGVESFGETGEDFDPLVHNAVMHVQDENLPENSIAQVFSKGYRVGSHLIRPASVQVAN